MINICTFYWQDPGAKHHGTYEFTPKHVDRLARGLKENLTIPYRFTCITDTPDGINTDLVSIVPLWNEFRDLGRCFVRLGLYSDAMLPVLGPRIANIDLDVAIVGNCDHIFGRQDPFIGYTDTKNPSCYSGCLYLMDTGAKSQVYNSFKRLYDMAPDGNKRKWFAERYNRSSSFVGSDQSWQTEVLGKGLPKLGQDDKIWDYWTIEHLPDLPEDARIVFTNGLRRDISMPEIHKKHPWADKYWNS